MNPIQEIKTTWQSIPPELKSFLKRALLIFIIWEFCYHMFLFNGRLIDKPITDFSFQSTIWVLKQVYPNSQFIVKKGVLTNFEIEKDVTEIEYIYLDNKNILGIADGCNALELYILFIGFLIAYPSNKKRCIFFGVTGVFIIFISNIIRLLLLAEMNLHQNNAVDIAHHYIFKLIVYAIIFILWMKYAQKQKND